MTNRDPSTGTVIAWTRPMLERFKVVNAQHHKGETFRFDGNEFDWGYAKYLIEYLEGNLTEG
jgi:hypothetical protein